MATKAQVARLTRPRSVLHPVYRDVALTGVASVGTSVAGLLIVSMVARWMGPSSVAEYLLVRRIATWMSAFSLLGMGVALPRYVAHAVGKKDVQYVYFAAALVVGVGLPLVFGVVMLLAHDTSSNLLFGKAGIHLVLPLALLLLGYCSHAVVFGFFRGRLQMKRTSAMQLISYFVLPLVIVAVLWRTRSIALIIAAIGASTTLISLLFALPVLPHVVRTLSRKLVQPTRELLRYGVSRIPGDIATGGLFTLPPIIAARFVPMSEVAYMLLGLGMLTVISQAVNPLNQVLLSKVSMMLALQRRDEARRYIEYLFAAALEVATFAALQVIAFTDVIVRLWVGPRFTGHLLLIRLLVAAIPLYLVYLALRSVIDAASVKAYNARNITSTLVTFVVLALASLEFTPANGKLEGVSAALLASFLLLSYLTYRTAHQLYDLEPKWLNSAPGVITGVVLGGIGILVRVAQGNYMPVTEFLTFELIASLAFLAVIYHLRTPWLMFIARTLFQPRGVKGDAEAVPDAPEAPSEIQDSL